MWNKSWLQKILDVIGIILSIYIIIGCFFTIANAAPSEVFIHGVVRNSTTNNLTTAIRDIYINISNTSTGKTIYNQTQEDQIIDNGVYQTTFTGLNSKWFLWPLSFIIKVGDDVFTSKTLVPVPIAHAAYWANDSQYLNGYSSSDFITSSAMNNGSLVYAWNTSWIPSYSSMGGFSSANETTYTNHGGFSKTNETTYTNHGGFSLANLSGSSNITISSNGVISINMSIVAGTVSDTTLINESELDNGSIVRSTNTTWLQTWYGTNGWRAANESYSTNGGWSSANASAWYTTNGFHTANETTYTNHGGFSLANLSGSSNISIDANGRIWVNATLGGGAGAGGGGIWIDGGDFIYINDSVAYRMNTTINYSQLLKCSVGQFLAIVNGSVKTFITTDDQDYNVKYRYLSNASAADQEHLAIGTEYDTNTVIRGVVNFDISSLTGTTVKKAIFRLALSTYYDPTYQSYPKVYYNYENPIVGYATCITNKWACWNYTNLSTYIGEWPDIMYYNAGGATVEEERFSDFIDIDVTTAVKAAIDNSNNTIQFVIKMDTDYGQNYTINGVFPAIEFISSTTWDSITPAQQPNDNSSRSQTKLFTWIAEPNDINYQCVDSLDIIKWGQESPKPQLSKLMMQTVLNNSLMVNCSQILFDTGYGNTEICDGDDATGGATTGNWDSTNASSWYTLNGWQKVNETTYTNHGGFSLANLSGSTNITISSSGQISINMTISSTDTNAGTICDGTTTYLDGEGNCDDISNVYWDACIDAYACGWYDSCEDLDGCGFLTTETTYANHGGFSLANLSGSLDNGSIIRNTNTSWLDGWWTNNNHNSSGNITSLGFGQFGYVNQLESTQCSIAAPINTLKLCVEEINGFSLYKYVDDTGLKQEMSPLRVVYNNLSTNISAYRIVYITGNIGNISTIALAKADSISTMPAIGITVEQINNGSYGRICVNCLLENVDTTYDALMPGDPIYVSDKTAGIIMNTPPITPNLTQQMGMVLVRNDTQGKLQIITGDLQGNEFGTVNNYIVQGNLTTKQVFADTWLNASAWFWAIAGLYKSENLTADLSKTGNINSSNSSWVRSQFTGGANITISTAGVISINLTETSYTNHGGFSKTNETTYANHGGWSATNASSYLQNNTDVVLNKGNFTENTWIMKNITINGFHIDKINSTHWKLWG